MNKRLVIKDRLFGVNTRSVEAEEGEASAAGEPVLGQNVFSTRALDSAGGGRSRRALPSGCCGAGGSGARRGSTALTGALSAPQPSAWPAQSSLKDQELTIGSHSPQGPVVQKAPLTALKVDQVHFPGRLFVVLSKFDSQACGYFLDFFFFYQKFIYLFSSILENRFLS